MMIGILSSIAIPQFMSAADKAKQKEASAIVASLVKSATAYNTEYGALPRDMGELSEYAMFQRCDHNDVAAEGGSVCKGSTPKKVPENVTQFYSTSGHYKIDLRRTNNNAVFKVRALPNGGAYAQNGSGVTGCYNPAQGVSQVKEMTSKSTGKGAKNCFSYAIKSSGKYNFSSVGIANFQNFLPSGLLYNLIPALSYFSSVGTNTL